jgi:molybdenum cofactor synthesis domain-containing protein
MIQMSVLFPVTKDKACDRYHVAPFTGVDFQALTAGIVIIGNEILSGMIKDSNSIFMARGLSAHGVKVGRTAIIPDEIDAIKEIIGQFSDRFTYVFTSGGIGPTHDDVTIEAISGAFNVQPVVNQYLKVLLHERFGDHLTSENLKIAQVPDGAELIIDQCLKFPLIKFKNVFILPGVPKLLRAKFFVSTKYLGNNALFVKKVYVARCESEIATFLNEVAAFHKTVTIGSYPAGKNGCSSVLITLEAYQKRHVEKALDHLTLGLPDKSIIQIE